MNHDRSNPDRFRARRLTSNVLVLLCLVPFAWTKEAGAQSRRSSTSLPQMVKKSGRYALIVDGAPYLILGVQVNNSSAWPAMLPKVWPAVQDLHANTVEMPIYWEQFEPERGRFDYAVLDTLLTQARQHQVHLVLLWFGTWKNASANYMPVWMKLSPELNRYVLDKDGRPINSPSPFCKPALEADLRAFSALMRHLKVFDRQHTVLMVQVENEPGTWGGVRDYSAEAQKAFESPVPRGIIDAMGKQAAPSANWRDVFGADADEYFHAWAIASYIEQVAAAGKAIYPLPLYTNAALRDPFNPGRPPSYESGAPTDNVIPLWKAAAPSLDLLAPDDYMPDSARYLKALDLYARPDNCLFVPESANRPGHSRFFFGALGRGAIGWAPFGLDYTGYVNAPLGAPKVSKDLIDEYALNYELIGPMDREIARLNFEGRLKAVVEEKGRPSETLSFGSWAVSVSYGLPQFGNADPPDNPEPTGRALVADLGNNQFLVAGFFCRVGFEVADPASGNHRRYLKVEEGIYEGGTFHPIRLWNGDQTDWGLNFTSIPQILRVTLGTY